MVVKKTPKEIKHIYVLKASFHKKCLSNFIFLLALFFSLLVTLLAFNAP